MPQVGEITSAILLWLAVGAIAVGVALAYRADRIDIAVGLLFGAASFSRITAPLGPYAIRLEQPALAVLIGLVVVREWGAVRGVVTRYRWPLAAGAIYLGANLASSALYAARPLDSLRIAGWLALSMFGGLAAAVLVARAPLAGRRLPTWVVGAASVQVAVGLAAVASEALFGTTWGVQATDAVLGKTYGLSWEANLLAINLAIALAFVIVPGSGLALGSQGRLVASIWLGMGLGLAYSRGGAVALLAALTLGGISIALASRNDRVASLQRYLGPLWRPALGALAAVVLTVGGIELLASRGVGWTAQVPTPTVEPTPAFVTPPPVSSPSPALPTEPIPPATEPPHVGTGDTVSLRFANISVALREVAGSPVIGLGTDSYPQRHIEPSCACPAAISNLLIGALYDSGVLGLLGLSAFLVGVLFLAWSRAAWAYLAALLVMVIGYQATDALRFASNWILLGAVVGIAARQDGPSTREPRASGSATRS